MKPLMIKLLVLDGYYFLLRSFLIKEMAKKVIPKICAVIKRYKNAESLYEASCFIYYSMILMEA
jgi:hypothetical protein